MKAILTLFFAMGGLPFFKFYPAENDQHLLETAAQCGKIVAAWGAGQLTGAFLLRAGRVRTLLEPFRDKIVCVGTTRDGFPRHPLYVRGDTPAAPFALTS